jgi:3-hydroxybutyryl-CoA dehydrogenase/5-formyl-3-hydroxy-2-methylpyridine 4-carboxylate dehydrogenase
MRIAVIGAGSMGPGMAARLARGGHDVAVWDVSPAALRRAESLLPTIGEVLDALGLDKLGGGVRFANSLADAVAGADLVIENVPESVDIKAALYRDLAPHLGPETILATDTSGIPITKLAAHVADPARFVGMHWSNPPHIVPMIEVIGGEATALETVAAVRDLILDLGLMPVVLKRDLPGFVENRVLYALLRECVDLVERGVVSPEDLDTCVRWGIGYKLSVVGPMRLLDMAGLDIYRSVASFLNADLCARGDVSSMILEQTERGRLGMKTSGGLFDYSSDELAALPRQRGERLVAVRRAIEAGEGG